MININNKIKQFFGGGWDRNEHWKIPNGFFQDDAVHHANKKKKHKKKDHYRYARDCCPFCKTKLAAISEHPLYFWRTLYVDTCENCGAFEVHDCPCCKQETWYNQNTNIYKHQLDRWGCGFEGERKY